MLMIHLKSWAKGMAGKRSIDNVLNSHPHSFDRALSEGRSVTSDKTQETCVIRKSTPSDIDMIYEIINDAARSYKGIIPKDRWHEPYMPKDDLEHEVEDGIIFWLFETEGEPAGIMGIEAPRNKLRGISDC